MRFPVVYLVFLCVFFSCRREQSQPLTPAKSAERAKIIRAYFKSPLKATDRLDGFWSVDAKEFADYLAKSGKNLSPSTGETRYFLRIEGSYCDELFFIAGGDFTMSAGAIRKLEAAKDRIAYSVVFNRELPGGIKTEQGAILTVFRAEKRLVLDFPDHKLTFLPELEKPATLADRFTGGFPRE